MKKISEYPALCWDFDGTLHDHPDSEQFAEFVRSNPFGQDHHIVTFRTHGLVAAIPRDLASLGLKTSNFKSIVTATNEMYEGYYMAQRTGSIDSPALKVWREFKGETCHSLGVRLLIDDMPKDVLPGCEAYSIDWIHPDDLGPFLP